MADVHQAVGLDAVEVGVRRRARWLSDVGIVLVATTPAAGWGSEVLVLAGPRPPPPRWRGGGECGPEGDGAGLTRCCWVLTQSMIARRRARAARAWLLGGRAVGSLHAGDVSVAIMLGHVC